MIIPNFETAVQLLTRVNRHRPKVRLQNAGDAIEFYREGILIYDIVLSQCRSRAQVLDWVRQIAQKSWSTRQIVSQLCSLLLVQDTQA